MMMRALAATVALFPAVTLAGPGPSFPTSWSGEANCDSSGHASCVKSEIDARRSLRERWDSIPEDVRRVCVRSAGSDESFVSLERCIRRELD